MWDVGLSNRCVTVEDGGQVAKFLRLAPNGHGFAGMCTQKSLGDSATDRKWSLRFQFQLGMLIGLANRSLAADEYLQISGDYLSDNVLWLYSGNESLGHSHGSFDNVRAQKLGCRASPINFCQALHTGDDLKLDFTYDANANAVFLSGTVNRQPLVTEPQLIFSGVNTAISHLTPYIGLRPTSDGFRIQIQ